MKTNAILFLSTILNVSFLLAQGTLTVATDKPSYQYGDTIEVFVKIANNTDSSFTIYGSPNCVVGINLQGVQIRVVCSQLLVPFPFPPGLSRTWTWHLKPSVLGYPVKGGVQTIYGYGEGGGFDSVTFIAPKYYGGLIAVIYNLSVPSSEIQSLRDSIGATDLSSDTLKSLGVIEETWSVVGLSTDSIVTAHAKDSKLNSIETYQLPLGFDAEFDSMSVTSVANNEHEPVGYALSQNYPNPFNPTTNIAFTIPTETHVRISIYDVTGRTVGVAADNDFEAGSHIITFNAASISSGTYYYTLNTPTYTQVRKMTVLK